MTAAPVPDDAVTPATRVATGRVLDTLTRPGGTVVLVGSDDEAGAAHVVRLAPVGVAVLDLVGAESATVAQLVDRLVERFGPPPGDPFESVAEALSDMSRLGVIRLIH